MFKPVFLVIVLLFSLLTTYIYANPVYIATDSRAYHYNRNCSDLNTTDLIEFASPQKADAAGAIPCKRCNSLGIIMVDKDNQDKQNKGVSSDIQTEIESNEGEYVGDLKDGKKHGQGTFTYSNGKKYVGEWKDDKRHGKGTITNPNGNKYVGEWKDDKGDGKGTITWSNGSKYVGEFKNNKMHGQGTETWPNGQKYVGVYKDGNKHGQGTYTWPSGNKYFGGWKDNKKHGHGTYVYANGKYYVGEWKEGEFRKKAYQKEKEKVRLNEFYVKNKPIAIMSSTTTPPIDELFANPFIYEDKTIVIVVNFERMQSANSAIFSVVEEGVGFLPPVLVVSNIPKGLFKETSTKCFLAGRVLGNTELIAPLIGQIQVPHLKFMDVLFAKKLQE
jgi:hypothetical protein